MLDVFPAFRLRIAQFHSLPWRNSSYLCLLESSYAYRPKSLAKVRVDLTTPFSLIISNQSPGTYKEEILAATPFPIAGYYYYYYYYWRFTVQRAHGERKTRGEVKQWLRGASPIAQEGSIILRHRPTTLRSRTHSVSHFMMQTFPQCTNKFCWKQVLCQNMGWCNVTLLAKVVDFRQRSAVIKICA